MKEKPITIQVPKSILTDLLCFCDMYEREHYKHDNAASDAEADEHEKILKELAEVHAGKNTISVFLAEFIDFEFTSYEGCDWWTPTHTRFYNRLELALGQLEPFVPGYWVGFSGTVKAKPHCRINGVDYQRIINY